MPIFFSLPPACSFSEIIDGVSVQSWSRIRLNYGVSIHTRPKDFVGHRLNTWTIMFAAYLVKF
jgi:hypothetical protein